MRLAILVTLLAVLCLSQSAPDPWAKSDVMDAASLAKEIQSAKQQTIISVAFPNLYHARHIVGAIDAGPGSKPEGIDLLKNAVAKLPKDASIVIYCGCCPMERCPNVRPAFAKLRELGYTNVRVVNIPTNMHTDWYEKNYPSTESAKSETKAGAK